MKYARRTNYEPGDRGFKSCRARHILEGLDDCRPFLFSVARGGCLEAPLTSMLYPHRLRDCEMRFEGPSNVRLAAFLTNASNQEHDIEPVSVS